MERSANSRIASCRTGRPVTIDMKTGEGKPSIVALVPARSGSKSVPRKNILPLNNHPLIAYPIVAARLSIWINQVVVSTDSEEIAQIARLYGAKTPFLRPAEISQDQSQDKEFFLHYLRFLGDQGEPIPDYIVHLRPTTPLRDARVVDAGIRLIMMDRSATALRSMHATVLTPYKMFQEVDGYAKPFLQWKEERESYNFPRQVFPKTYIPNGYVDIIRPDVLLKTGQLHGDRIRLFHTVPVPDIDALADYHTAQTLLAKPEFQELGAQLNYVEGVTLPKSN